MPSVKPLEKDIQTALRFLEASPQLLLSTKLTPMDFAALDHQGLAELASSWGYEFEAPALGEAFRIRMLARFLAQQRSR